MPKTRLCAEHIVIMKIGRLTLVQMYQDAMHRAVSLNHKIPQQDARLPSRG
jgi:hypothetical protein